MKNNYSKEYLDAMRTETANWKGLVYFNRKDPRLLVPKTNQALGWTMNFASPYAWIVMGIIVAAIACSIFL
jgi:uncharacterized membrane protein